ncbi:protein of unknown function [Lactiplantibacillus plantarum]
MTIVTVEDFNYQILTNFTPNASKADRFNKKIRASMQPVTWKSHATCWHPC